MGGIHDRVQGLEAGGDDYLVKPFAFAELLARVRVLSRRPGHTQEPATRLSVGSIELDLLNEPSCAPARTLNCCRRISPAGVFSCAIRSGAHAAHAAGKCVGIISIRNQCPSKSTSAGCAVKSIHGFEST